MTTTAITLDMLPAATIVRWTAKAKALVVGAVAQGIITEKAACDLYSISSEEFGIWTQAVNRSGMPGLRVTRIQQYQTLYQMHA